jgi:hypothetical protein
MPAAQKKPAGHNPVPFAVIDPATQLNPAEQLPLMEVRPVAAQNEPTGHTAQD